MHSRRFGFPKIKSLVSLAKIQSDRVYSHSLLRTYIRWSGLALVSLVVWSITNLSGFAYVALFSTILMIRRTLRLSQPPAVLLLGDSNPFTMEVHLALQKIFLPLSVQSLTRPKGDFAWFYQAFGNLFSYRTNEEEWRRVVKLLIAVCPVLVMCATRRSEPVDWEIKAICEAQAINRLFFFSGSPDSECEIFGEIPRNRIFSAPRLELAMQQIRDCRATALAT